MAFWSVDLTTVDGAENAAASGAYGCYAATGLGMLGLVIYVMTTADSPDFGAGIIAILIEIGVFLIAGLRLRVGKGFFWGMAASMVMAIEIFAKIAALAFSFGIVINIAILVTMINGVRGARILRRGGVNDEDLADIFE